MAQLTFPVTPAGLAVPVYVGLDGPTAAARLSAGQAVPPLVPARGLLDTGSDLTAVAPWVLQQLAVPRMTTASTQTAAGPVTVNVYTVSLSITDPSRSGSPMWTLPSLLVTELATTLQDADVLVGLNVLLQGKLVLEGPSLQFTLEF